MDEEHIDEYKAGIKATRDAERDSIDTERTKEVNDKKDKIKKLKGLAKQAKKKADDLK